MSVVDERLREIYTPYEEKLIDKIQAFKKKEQREAIRLLLNDMREKMRKICLLKWILWISIIGNIILVICLIA